MKWTIFGTKMLKKIAEQCGFKKIVCAKIIFKEIVSKLFLIIIKCTKLKRKRKVVKKERKNGYQGKIMIRWKI